MTPAPEENPVGLPRNYLRPCLLLLLAEGTSHGYDLLDQVRAMGLERVDPGGLYRSLRSMDEEGLVRSQWEPSAAGPARRTYALTPEGQEWLHVVAGGVEDLYRILGEYRARYRDLGEAGPAEPGFGGAGGREAGFGGSGGREAGFGGSGARGPGFGTSRPQPT